MNKKIAPTFITIILCIGVALVWGSVSIMTILSGNMLAGIIGLIFGICAFAVIIAFIVNLVKRYREIDKEEDDDLSKY